jgi:hypothetical protein
MLSLRISSPLSQGTPVEIVRLDTAIATATWTTAIQFGWTTASVTLKTGRRNPVPAGAHCELFWDGNLVYEGMRRRPKLVGKDLDTLEMVGYGTALSDADVMETKALATAGPLEPQYTSNICLTQAMAMAPLLSIGAVWGSPAVSHALSIFDGMTLAAIATQLGNESGFDWAVWEGRRASFTARTAPTTADYLIAEDDVTDWEIDDSSVWTRVSVQYTDSLSGSTVTSPIFPSYAAEAQLGVIRHTRLSGGTLDAPGAFAQAQTYLAQHITPTIAGTLGPYSQLKQPFGGYAPGPYVRSAQWAKIQGRDIT